MADSENDLTIWSQSGFFLFDEIESSESERNPNAFQFTSEMADRETELSFWYKYVHWYSSVYDTGLVEWLNIWLFLSSCDTKFSFVMSIFAKPWWIYANKFTRIHNLKAFFICRFCWYWSLFLFISIKSPLQLMSVYFYCNLHKIW